VSLHTKMDERRLAEERARKASQPFTQGWQDSVFSHVYWQGYSFIYFCYEGSENRYKKQMDEWRAWQWSMASISSYTSGGYMQAWRKFKEIFGDTDKVQAEWWAWEDSLEF